MLFITNSFNFKLLVGISPQQDLIRVTELWVHAACCCYCVCYDELFYASVCFDVSCVLHFCSDVIDFFPFLSVLYNDTQER